MEPPNSQCGGRKRPTQADEPSGSTNAGPLASVAGPSGAPCQKKCKPAVVPTQQRSSLETATSLAGQKTKGADCMQSKSSNGQAKRKAAARIPLANLENAKGSFTGAAIDYRLPCTVSENTACQIVGQLSTWNEFLCKAHLELREMPGTRSRLSLSQCCRTTRFRTTEEELHKAITLAYWLLKTHECVAAVDIPDFLLGTVHSSLLSIALQGKASVKSLTFGVPHLQFPKDLCKVIPSLPQLETLEFVGEFHFSEAPLKAAVALLLQTTASLTCLRIPALHWRNGRDAGKFLAALEASSTLQELSVHMSLIERVSRALKEVFKAYVRNSTTLTTLTVNGSYEPSKDTIYWFLSGIGGNKTLSNLNLVRFEMDGLAAGILPIVFKQNKSLRSFNWRDAWFDFGIGLYPNRYDSWFEVFTQTETLEELTLPMYIWDKEQWMLFFKALAKNRNLKDVTIEVDVLRYKEIFEVYTALKESGAASKVLFKYERDLYEPLFSPITFPSKGFSELCIGPVWELQQERLSRQLRKMPSYTNITSIDLDIHQSHWNNALFSAFSKFVESTATLRKLCVTSVDQYAMLEPDAMTKRFWMLLVSSLSQNISVRELSAEMCVDEEIAKGLADVIKASRNIRRVHLKAHEHQVAVAFIQRLSISITDNYRLTCVTLEDSEPITEQGWFKIRSVAARNSSLVTRAAQYVSGVACDRYRAQALERVFLSPSLMEEVAEVTSISNSETISRVREGLRSFEGLHDFMRVCGVVREKVTCHPRKDGRTQLDQLNVHCWSHIRHYLLVEDIKMSTQSANAVDSAVASSAGITSAANDCSHTPGGGAGGNVSKTNMTGAMEQPVI